MKNKLKQFWLTFTESSATYWVVETWLYICAGFAALTGAASLFATYFTVGEGETAGEQLKNATEMAGVWQWVLRIFNCLLFLTLGTGCWFLAEHVGELRKKQAWNRVRVPRDLKAA